MNAKHFFLCKANPITVYLDCFVHAVTQSDNKPKQAAPIGAARFVLSLHIAKT